MDKQREFLNKADAKKKNWETKGPWIVLGVAFAMAVFLAWLLFYLGVKFDATNIATRLAECTNASAGAR